MSEAERHHLNALMWCFRRTSREINNRFGRIGNFSLSTTVVITTFWHALMALGRLHYADSIPTSVPICQRVRRDKTRDGLTDRPIGIGIGANLEFPLHWTLNGWTRKLIKKNISLTPATLIDGYGLFYFKRRLAPSTLFKSVIAKLL